MDVFTEGFYATLALEVIADVVLKATILLSAAWLATVLLRRASAATRYSIWSLVLSGLLIMPVVSVMVPSWEMEVPAPMLETPAPAGTAFPSSFPPFDPAPPAPSPSPRDAVEAEEPLPTGHPLTSSGAPAHRLVSEAPEVVGRPWQPWVTWGLILWLVGALVLLGRLLVDVVRVARITRHACDVSEGPHVPVMKGLTPALRLRRPVRILYSSHVSMPMMWGLWRPVVILPETARAWSQERFRLVLLHELAHVKRWDYLTHLVVQVVWSLYWLNPLVWFAARRVSLEQERACDDLVLKAGTRASTYAEHLLDLTRSLQRHGGLMTPMAMAKGSTLKERIRAILNTRLDRRALTPRVGVASTLMVAGLLVPLAALHLNKENHDQEARVEQMIDALHAAVPETRQRAAWALGGFESPLAVDALIERLSDPDAGVRSMAAWALGEIKDPHAVEALIEALPDFDSYVTEMIVRALGEIEDARAVPALVDFSSEEDPSLRATTAWALGEIKGSYAVEALAVVLQNDPDDRVRQAAVEALSHVESTRALDVLILALRDESPAVRKTAVQTLTDLPARRPVESLVVTLRQDGDVAVRTLAAAALGHLADPQALNGLLDGLQDAHPWVREQSARALGLLGNPDAVGGLMKALRDPDARVRAMAVWALDEINVS